jgi:hypothetical protein
LSTEANLLFHKAENYMYTLTQITNMLLIKTSMIISRINRLKFTNFPGTICPQD